MGVSYFGSTNPNWRGGPQQQACKQCGAIFFPPRRERGRKYCSRGCAYASPSRSPRSRVKRACVVCGVEFKTLPQGSRSRVTCSERCLSLRKEEHNRENGAALKGVPRWNGDHPHPKGMAGKRHSQATKDRLALTSKGNVQTEEMKAKGLATKLARYGTAAPPNNGNAFSRARRGRREDLGGQYFRSAWEANYARYLNWLMRKNRIKGWKYEARLFRYEGVTRGPYTYLPDFEVETLDGGVVYHEVKGWMTPKSRSQIRRMRRFFPDVQLYVVDEGEYNQIKVMGKWYSTFWE